MKNRNPVGDGYAGTKNISDQHEVPPSRNHGDVKEKPPWGQSKRGILPTGQVNPGWSINSERRTPAHLGLDGAMVRVL